MRLSWRAIVSPEALLLLGAVQANLPYVLWRYYPVCDRYPVRISYEVLPLWGWAYGAFVLGAVHVSTCMVRRRREDRGLPYKVDGGRFRLALIVVLGAFGVQLCMACILYGVIPLVAYFRGFHVATLNLLQERSAFGQLGLLMLTRFVLNALIIVGFVGPQESASGGRKLLWAAVILSVFGGVFAGKTQGLFLFVCAVFTGCALAGATPVVVLARGLGFGRPSSAMTLLIIVVLAAGLLVVHGFTRAMRIGQFRNFALGYAMESAVEYLSWPLLNMEHQVAIMARNDAGGEPAGILGGLLPYKMQEALGVSERSRLPRIEPTSPSGLLSGPLWHFGWWGMILFMFCLGVLCRILYVQSARSLFCLLAYSQIAWTLVAAHSYNHFFNLLYIPAPIAIFAVLARFIARRRTVREADSNLPGIRPEAVLRCARGLR
ncbi:MAG TPA: O-antigen polymerase [Anaerohalosphaeraceae bacterium]|nr:O-antigen polymerase [Anaerohalosphaeraceae bacterium]HRT48975.1 O-antigen polymerase [Anaerohalosphaeraceae bacterium]HRT85098.1 O-antigen polymerase [Anaerohalosphaeraceae bacterium]